jgi:hypothetical protein
MKPKRRSPNPETSEEGPSAWLGAVIALVMILVVTGGIIAFLGGCLFAVGIL